mgnify:CR=1 FL=1
MTKSTTKFSRWEAHDSTTWAFQIFTKYNSELASFRGAHEAAKLFTYRELGARKATWTDPFKNHFPPNKVNIDYYNNLKFWSESYNGFHNWINLSSIMSISSHLETYMACVIAIAIDSDPGVLLGASKSIDGASVLKHRKQVPHHLAQHIVACTKGTWPQRLSAFEVLFGTCPPEMKKLQKDLEKIRLIRNRFGHAFGRDIEDAQKHGNLKIEKIEKVSDATFFKLEKTTRYFVKYIDELLLKNHIGDFEAVYFYHNIYPLLPKNVNPNQRAQSLKKEIGRIGAGIRGKKYCRELVSYWEVL